MLFLDISTFCQCHPQLIYDQRRTGKKSNYELPFLSFSYCHIFSECGWLLQERNTNKEELDRMARQFVFFRLPFFFYIRIKFCDLIGKCGFSGLLAYPLTQPQSQQAYFLLTSNVTEFLSIVGTPALCDSRTY